MAARFSHRLLRLWAHRRRAAPAVLILALLAVGGEVLRVGPRTTWFRYALGREHANAQALRIAYMQGEDEIKGAEFSFRGAAPDTVRHRVSLAPGTYTVVAVLDGPRLHREIRTKVNVPAEGELFVSLRDP